MLGAGLARAEGAGALRSGQAGVMALTALPRRSRAAEFGVRHQRGVAVHPRFTNI